MAERERQATWQRSPERVPLVAIVRQLRQKLRLRQAELRRLQERIDGLKARVGALEP